MAYSYVQNNIYHRYQRVLVLVESDQSTNVAWLLYMLHASTGLQALVIQNHLNYY